MYVCMYVFNVCIYEMYVNSECNVCMYIGLYVYTKCKYVYEMYVYTECNVCIYEFMCVCVSVRGYVCMDGWVDGWMDVCVYVCVRVRMYVCVYVCM